MTDETENPSILSHVSIGVHDFDQAIKFYDAVLGAMGIRKIMSHPGATAYGREYPEFWVQTPEDGTPPSVGNGTHFGFVARSKDEVHAFWDAAIANGATPDGEPGPRPHYGEPYYGCFVRDPDGHKIEATYWDMELMHKLGMGA
ncbi:MAG: VOC family protein [Hyphomicrobiales bacterium]